MSLATRTWITTLSIAALVAIALPPIEPASAQDEDESDDEEESADDGEGPFPGDGRFFFERPAIEDAPKETRVSGSLTSSTFLYREFGVFFFEGDPDAEGQGSAQRLMTDLRAQISADDMGGGTYDFRGDVRARFVPGTCKVNDPELNEGNPCRRLQSGSFSGNEFDLRELYLTRKSGSLDINFGRQFVLELAAHRLDGAAFHYRKSAKTTLIGFAGLNPQKGSRDLRQDYPKSATQSDGEKKRLLPLTGGAGLAYRFERLYGSLGAVGILPLAEEQEGPGQPGQLEDPRVFLVANGYFRTSPKLDLYHYMVFDALGSAAGDLTNFTVGANARPSPRLRANLALTHIDTETLAVLADTKLETPDMNGGAIQNNIEVLRIAQDSVRAGLSGAFKQRRYELSTSLAIRQRPETTLTSANGMATIVLPNARDIEAMVSFVDRRSIGQFRLGASAARSFGLGDDRFQRASTLSLRGTARKTVANGKGEIDFFLAFVQSKSIANFTPMEAGGAPNCSTVASAADVNEFEACFAGSKATSARVGATAFYRLGERLMAIGSVGIGTQAITAQVAEQNSIMPLSVFLRLAYRL